ncbi:hypothetical protein [Catellatospora paridis]|uniref:hypothetical protein n=1 Tax=Catellatospora paridis TaxID=1617086 RepID=UPI0012D3ED7F|nr:hypothetical protein [Catellatospora paridis]
MSITLVPQSGFVKLRHAWNRRYFIGVLHETRRRHEQWEADLQDTAILDDAAIQRFRPILRTHVVQWAAFACWPGWWLYAAMRLVTAIIAVATPVVGLVLWAPDSLFWASLTCYVCVGTIFAFAYGLQQHTTRAWHLALAASVISAGLVSVWLAGSPNSRTALWRALGTGVLATGALLVLTVARLAALLATRARLLRPRAIRRAGWLLPPQHAAVLLLTVLLTFERARASNRPPGRRVHFLDWLDWMTDFIRWEVTTMASLGFSRHLRGDIADKAACLATYLRRQQRRLLHDSGLSEYDAVTVELAEAVTALAAGNWTPIEAVGSAADEPSRLLRLTRRLLPAVLLTGTAVSLPYLPGVPDSGNALVGVQLGLVAAAALSLLPPLEQTHRDQITTAFSSAAK